MRPTGRKLEKLGLKVCVRRFFSCVRTCWNVGKQVTTKWSRLWNLSTITDINLIKIQCKKYISFYLPLLAIIIVSQQSENLNNLPCFQRYTIHALYRSKNNTFCLTAQLIFTSYHEVRCTPKSTRKWASDFGFFIHYESREESWVKCIECTADYGKYTDADHWLNIVLWMIDNPITTFVRNLLLVID